MKDQIRKIILEVVANLWKERGLKETDIEINKAPENFGDYSTNVAMKLARIVKENPLEIARKIEKNIWNPPAGGPLAHSQLRKNRGSQTWIYQFLF